THYQKRFNPYFSPDHCQPMATYIQQRCSALGQNRYRFRRYSQLRHFLNIFTSMANMNSTSYPVRISKDIVYGTGAIQPESDGQIKLRNLTLDLYEPRRSDNTQKCPALIMAFGGACHRGTKEDDTLGEPPAQNNSVAWYCQAFARRGFITCSIDYRLIPENPEPGCTPVVFDPNTIPRSRVDEVRRLMGLPKASQQLLWRGIEAASDDMRLAVSFVRRKAEQWNIDTAKIAIGGFSAGARTALNVALGEREN